MGGRCWYRTGVKEPPEFFNDCHPSTTVGTISLRGSYSVESWLRVGVVGSTHSEFSAETCVLPDVERDRVTRTEYREGIQKGASYVSTEARAVIIPKGSVGTVQPFVLAGVGRIWDKEIHYPELGVGASVPVGGVHLRFEALGRWLSVPYDLVRYERNEERELVELSRTSLDEEHFPLLFRVGVGWRP